MDENSQCLQGGDEGDEEDEDEEKRGSGSAATTVRVAEHTVGAIINGLLNSFKLTFHSDGPADECNLDVWKTNLELLLANFGSGMAKFSAIHHGQHMT